MAGPLGGFPASAPATPPPPAPAPPTPPAPLAAARVARPVEAYPRLEAPTYVPAHTEFLVTVGLAGAPQPGLASAAMRFHPPDGAATFTVGVDLLADGLDAPDGWHRQLVVPVADPTSAQVTFRLVGRDPPGPEPVHLCSLQVRYVFEGLVCGTASRPLVIGQAGAPTPCSSAGLGTSWPATPASASPVSLARDDLAPDLTIEIAKTDGNATSGRFQCRLYSRHAFTTSPGPYDIDLGQDARTFAASLTDELGLLGGKPIVDNLLRSLGDLVKDALPTAAFAALHEVAARTAPEPPAVLIVSAEPFVPWELAMVDPPLDPTRPPFLGAQALVGRWLRDHAGQASPPAVPGGAPVRPPIHPPAHLQVQRLAAMAGSYQAASGLQPLPSAEGEVAELARTHHARALPATCEVLKRLLDATLDQPAGPPAGADAMHFAGHGRFDPTRPEGSVLYLSDGTPLTSLLFRSARYGEPHQPLLFLNACMIGIGGELLGSMSGFPGNCLKGGFGGLLGALWAVDDGVAGALALDFWDRALPPDGATAAPQPVGAILRELRGRYDGAHPESTWLAYVFYGHPRLTLSA